ncbi:MAG TPA: hypothetical protein VG722_05175, partial [Tepidisphaeraceae bacterium]|nr:hypothetical protein [Tepidisphaeraceae bacterium]
MLAALVGVLILVLQNLHMPAARLVFALTLIAFISLVALRILKFAERQIQLSETADLLIEEQHSREA